MPRLLSAALAAAALAFASAAPAQGAAQVSAYPSPGTSYNLPKTQIAFRGIAASQIGQVQVVGSVTGPHSGIIKADSDGDGGSFIPTQSFARGETVTVATSLNVIGARHGRFSFKIADTAGPVAPMHLPIAPAVRGSIQHYRSEPDLQPPALRLQGSPPGAEGDIFLTPQYGPLQNGPMIVDPHGRLVWFDPLPVKENMIASDLRVQTLFGRQVLTWWQGYTNLGSGRGVGLIVSRSYRLVGVVHAGNGLMMDLHEFLLTPNGRAWVIAVSPVHLPHIRKRVMDAVVQEIDLRTGLVLFEWHALDHVPLRDSYFTPQHTGGSIFDPYHLNSISLDGKGAIVISMRNTFAVYKIDLATGKIDWQLGGRHSSFRLGPGVATAFQHDAVVQDDGTLTIFDDGAGPPNLHPYARGIRVRIDTRNRTATLVKEYDHSPPISTNFEGDVQVLPDGSVFMGWGQQPYFSEDTSAGKQIFDGRFVSATSSYRAYRFVWSAQPAGPPALAVGAGKGSSAWIYASWNGATDVARWRVLAGSSASSLAAIATHSSSGFETAIHLHNRQPYYAVQALGGGGRVLATSAVTQASFH